ncbi:MAG: EamA family transporter [Sphingobium sp.]|nr:EamA family transporter [Sphingobium sp.]
MTASSARSALLPVLACCVAMACFQIGAALAKQLFVSIGPMGTATLRLAIGAAVLIVVTRPWRNWPARVPGLALLGLGASVAGAILFYYLAIDRLPLGIAMPVQFLGPLVLATVMSRGVMDLVWVALAALGIWCLLGTGGTSGHIDPVGILFALGAAVSWAVYILAGKAAGDALGSAAAPASLGIAAIILLPIGTVHSGTALLDPAILPFAALVAIVSATIPFWLELYAMPRLPTRTFSVLMSLEPAFAVLFGLVMLGERLSLVQTLGVALVVGSSIGSVLTIRENGTAAGLQSLD